MVKGSLYLLVGKEEFLKREFIQELRKKLGSPNTDTPLEYQEFHASKDAFSLFRDFLSSGSLFSAKKLAVLWECDEVEEEAKVDLLAMSAQLIPGACLVLCANQGSAKKDAFLSKLSTSSHTQSFHPPYEKDLPSWIDARAKKRGCILEKDANFFLMAQVGREVAALDEAIEKLSIYIHPKKNISLADTKALLGRSAQADVFGLMDVLLEKDGKSAIEMLQGLLRDGEKGFEIMGVLVSQLDKLKKVCVLNERGFSPEEIGSSLKIHPYYLPQTLRQAKKASRPRLEALLNAFLKCDEAMKTGKLNDQLALQELVLGVCLA